MSLLVNFVDILLDQKIKNYDALDKDPSGLTQCILGQLKSVTPSPAFQKKYQNVDCESSEFMDLLAKYRAIIQNMRTEKEDENRNKEDSVVSVVQLK